MGFEKLEISVKGKMAGPGERDVSRVEMERYFGPEGLLAERIGGFEVRASQLRMAEAAMKCLRSGTPLLVEAGTGAGKTWAYLIPAIESGMKVVISTGAKALQEQIFDHDIPLLKKHFFPDLHAVCLKGRGNYLCLRRWREFSYQPSFWNNDEGKLFSRLGKWAARTKTGENAEIPWLPDHSRLWSSISSGVEQCLGQACPERQQCFLTLVRQEAHRARLLIVNHHLFFADLALRKKGLREVLPDYEAVVFDEAHQLEDIVGLYFGVRFSGAAAGELVGDVGRECGKLLGEASHRAHTARLMAIQGNCHQLETLCRQAHQGLSQALGTSRARFRLDLHKTGKAFSAAADQIVETCRQLGASLSLFSENHPVLESSAGRALELADSLDGIMARDDPLCTYWCELAPHGFFLHGTPIELAPILRDHLFESTSAVVFTSATLSAAGSFGFFRDRLGIPPESADLALPSPFSIEEQALLYIPASFPEPREEPFCARMAEETLKVLAKTRGRALFLFTSYRNLHQVHELIRDRLSYPILVQGENPKRTLLNRFREEIESVLLATSSFWEGIDVPGEALSCVLIDKLPFEVPDDPIASARMELLEKQGKNAFLEYQTPKAILHLKQGVGRLLRSSSDRGVVVIFDIRLRTKGYGKLFLRSLPPYRLAGKIEELDDFFADF